MSGLPLRDARGLAHVVAILLLIPLLLAAVAAGSSVATSVTVADVDAQEAVAFACKAAAASVSPRSQAEGKPRVKADLAHSAFRDTLARNMGLDVNTLQRLPVSFYASSPRYWLVVYNGYSDYVSDGAPGARLYYFDGTTVTESGLPYSGFPAFFAVSPTGIVLGSGGTFTIRLESPGVVALVECEARRFVGEVPIRVQRWGSARIVCVPGGGCRVV